MVEAFVRLRCPARGKGWQDDSAALSDHRASFDCPDRGAARRLAEFMRTERDLEGVRQFERARPRPGSGDAPPWVG